MQSIPHQPGRALGATDTTAAFTLAAFALISSVFLQKFALPGTGGQLPLNTVLFPLIAVCGLVTRLLDINLTALLWYSVFLVSGTISLALSGAASPTSLGLLILVQSPLILLFAQREFPRARLFELLSNIGCICAVLGVAQFAAQFVVGSRVAFFLDSSLPPGFITDNFNVMNPLYYGAAAFKSNGVFFLEPSFFCQFLAIVFISELNNNARVWRLGVLAIGIISSYSGTGLTTLLLYLPFYVVMTRQLKILVLGVLGALVVFLLADTLQLDVITRRIAEFSDNQSSGSARFTSMLHILGDLFQANDTEFLFGRGPGTVQETFARQNFLAFDPTWGKVIYEYGLVGAIVYVGFFWTVVRRGAPNLRFALSYTYFVLGGYLLNPSVVMQLAVLAVWLRVPAKEAAGDGTEVRS